MCQLKVYLLTNSRQTIVGKEVHIIPLFLDQPPFSKIPPFLEIQDVPTFHRPIGKTKVLRESERFAYNFLSSKYLNFERIFTKVVKCKPYIMPLNVFLSIL